MMTNNEKDDVKVKIDDQQQSNTEEQDKVAVDDSADKLLRLRAEFDNFRKRSRKDIVNIRKNAKIEFLKELFPVTSNLERAVEEAEKNFDNEYSKGFRLILEQLKEINANHGVEEINPKGGLFDPLLHEAFMVQEDDSVPENTVLEVIEKGYVCDDNLLKPARVIVSKVRDS